MSDIKKRDECEIIPQGVSHTETEMTHYIRLREMDTILTLRIPKNDWLQATIVINKRLENELAISIKKD